MSIEQIRLNSVISLEAEQEKDIIELVKRLNASHKMGEFVTVLLRVAADCPELLEKRKGRFESGEVTRAIHKQGMSDARMKLAKEQASMIVEMRKKVDYLYDETLKLGAALEAGNRLGIQGKLENNVLANFILRKQIEEMQKNIGFGGYGKFKADIVGEHLKKVDDIMEYIIATYANEFSELKKIVEVRNDTEVVHVDSSAKTPVVNVTENVVEKVAEKVEQPSETKKGVELVVDDTDDDFDASLLDTFFGN